MRMRAREEGRERRKGWGVARAGVLSSKTGMPRRHPSKGCARARGREGEKETERGGGKGLRKHAKNRKNERPSLVYKRRRGKHCGKARRHRKQTKKNERKRATERVDESCGCVVRRVV